MNIWRKSILDGKATTEAPNWKGAWPACGISASGAAARWGGEEKGSRGKAGRWQGTEVGTVWDHGND